MRETIALSQRQLRRWHLLKLEQENRITLKEAAERMGLSYRQASRLKDKAARRYATLTFDEAIMRNLKVMDATALALCRDQNMLLKVFSIFVPGALSRVVMGEDEGTLVHC